MGGREEVAGYRLEIPLNCQLEHNRHLSLRFPSTRAPYQQVSVVLISAWLLPMSSTLGYSSNNHPAPAPGRHTRH